MEQSYGFPEFDASYDPIVTESKGMLKTPEFDASYDPIVTEFFN